MMSHEIALVEKLIADSKTLSQNQQLTVSHRQDCLREHHLFENILTLLKTASPAPEVVPSTPRGLPPLDITAEELQHGECFVSLGQDENRFPEKELIHLMASSLCRERQFRAALSELQSLREQIAEWAGIAGTNAGSIELLQQELRDAQAKIALLTPNQQPKESI